MSLPPVAGVIGWPVAHSKSPLIHRFWLGKLGMDGDYSRFPVAPERLGTFVRALPAMGLRGVNVTIPHKVAVMGLLEEIDENARMVGAVNVVRVLAGGRLGGANTDVEGICGPLGAYPVGGREMIILGSGGAARAALVAAMRLGAGWVTIRARDVERAAGLLREAGQPGEALAWDGPMPRSGEAAVLFNATSLGMAGQPGLTFDLGVLAGDGVVFDAVYVPLETELLRGARERGLATIDGLAMLIGQAALAFEMFFGVAPPRADGDAELRAVLRR